MILLPQAPKWWDFKCAGHNAWLFLLLLTIPLVSYPRNHCHSNTMKLWPYVFFFKSSIVLTLIFKSLIHFELVFMEEIRV
jgi:hypothetical protein